MKKVVVVALLLGIVCGAVFAAPTISISQLPGRPEGWNPGSGNDIDLVNMNTVSLPYSDQPYRLHVGVLDGIWGFHIVGIPTVSQGLFACQSTSFTADLSGAYVPFCTYLTLDSNAGLNLTPTPEPGGMLVLGTGLAALAGFMTRRRR